VTGHIKTTADFKAARFWAALVQEPASIMQSNIGVILATVLPSDRAVIAVEGVSLRSGPGSSLEMGPVEYGVQVQILGQVADWFAVKLPNGRTGFGRLK
jgi:hypothetical protein